MSPQSLPCTRVYVYFSPFTIPSSWGTSRVMPFSLSLKSLPADPEEVFKGLSGKTASFPSDLSSSGSDQVGPSRRASSFFLSEEVFGPLSVGNQTLHGLPWCAPCPMVNAQALIDF